MRDSKTYHCQSNHGDYSLNEHYKKEKSRQKKSRLDK